MSNLKDVLENAFVHAGAREDAHWEALKSARKTVVDRATVPEVTARKWMSIVESGHQPLSAPENAKIVEKIKDWAGQDAVTEWLDSYQNFAESSARVHRAGLELADYAGIDARLDLEGLREEGQMRQKLLSIAARINPTLDVHMPKELFMEGPGLIASGLKSEHRTEIAGMYEPYKHLATISVSPRFDREDTAWHEAWHSIEPVLTDKEKNVLAKAFPNNGHMISTERVAVAFARWAKMRDRLPEDTREQRAMSAKFREALAPSGNKTVQGIFEKAYDGTFGQRMVKAMAHTQPAFLEKITSRQQAAAKTSASNQIPGFKIEDERDASTAQHDLELSRTIIAKTAQEPRFLIGRSQWLRTDEGIKKRKVADVAIDGSLVVDRNGAFYRSTNVEKAGTTRRTPLERVPTTDIGHALEKAAIELHAVRMENKRNMNRFDDEAIKLAEQLGREGFKGRVVIPNDTSSRYIFVEIPTSPTEFKIRIADHGEPVGEFTDPRHGGRVFGTAGGWSDKLGDRHPPSHISIHPGSHARVADAIAAVRSLSMAKMPLTLKAGDQSGQKAKPPLPVAARVRKKGLSR